MFKALAGLENAYPVHPFLVWKVEGFHIRKSVGSDFSIFVYSDLLTSWRGAAWWGLTLPTFPSVKSRPGYVQVRILHKSEGILLETRSWGHMFLLFCSYSVVFPLVGRVLFPRTVHIDVRVNSLTPFLELQSPARSGPRSCPCQCSSFSLSLCSSLPCGFRVFLLPLFFHLSFTGYT